MMHRIKKKNDVNQDKWIGIGGKLEENESPDQCLLREVWEETGLILSDFRFHGVVTFQSDTWEGEYMYLFSCGSWTGQMLESCTEGTLEWIPKEQVPNLPIWEGDKIFLHLMEEKRDAFLLKLEYQGDRLIRAVLNGKDLSL